MKIEKKLAFKNKENYLYLRSNLTQFDHDIVCQQNDNWDSTVVSNQPPILEEPW